MIDIKRNYEITISYSLKLKISLYDIIDNKPKMLDEIEADASVSSLTVINQWLTDNGYSDSEHELIQL